MSKQYIESFLNDFFGFLKINPAVSVEELEEDTYGIKIEGPELNFLIGSRGMSLNALQTIISQGMFNKTSKWSTIFIDINDYRNQKMEKLQGMAKKFIDKVRFFKQDVELPPMSSWERRQIHMFVGGYDDVTTESRGEGRDRHIVLKPKN